MPCSNGRRRATKPGRVFSDGDKATQAEAGFHRQLVQSFVDFIAGRRRQTQPRYFLDSSRLRLESASGETPGVGGPGSFSPSTVTGDTTPNGWAARQVDDDFREGLVGGQFDDHGCQSSVAGVAMLASLRASPSTRAVRIVTSASADQSTTPPPIVRSRSCAKNGRRCASG